MAGVKKQLFNLVRLVLHPGVAVGRSLSRELRAVLLGRSLPQQGKATRAAE